jgi:hypothetical protein
MLVGKGGSMRNIVERMDWLRTLCLRIFVFVFGLLMGFWIFSGLALAFLRTKRKLDFHGQGWKRYFDFFNSIQPVLKISIIVALAFFGISLAVWLLYKRKLARNPAIDTAVRDERVRLIWLLAFRKAILAVIALQFILWILQDLSPFFLGRYFVKEDMYFHLTLFVLVVTSLGIFLALDRRSIGLAENEETAPPLFSRLTSFESAVVRKAPSLLGLIIGWDILYIIGTIYRNFRFLKIMDVNDYARIERNLNIIRAGWIAWIAVLAILVYRLLIPSIKARRARAQTAMLDDERARMNWLRACRFSVLFVLAMLFISTLPAIALAIIWGMHLPYDLARSLTRWGYIVSDLRLILMAAPVALLGSFLHYDRKD